MVDIKLTVKGVEVKGIKPIEYKCQGKEGVLLSQEDFDLMCETILKESGFKNLLLKYITHVRQCEGIDFIDRLNSEMDSDIEFTDGELATLKLFSEIAK